MAKLALKPSKKSLTLLIILAAAVFFGCVLSYMAMAGKVKGVMAELESKQKSVAEGRRVAKTLSDCRLKYFDARSELRHLESSVSSQEYVPTLLKQLENLGTAVDLKVTGVRPTVTPPQPQARSMSSGKKASEGDIEGAGKTHPAGEQAEGQEPVKPYDELVVELQLHGKYMDTLAFLHKLTSFPKIIAVNDIHVAPKGPTPTFLSPELDVKMNVTAFVLKDEDKTPGSSAPAAGMTGSNQTKLESGNEAG